MIVDSMTSRPKTIYRLIVVRQHMRVTLEKQRREGRWGDQVQGIIILVIAVIDWYHQNDIFNLATTVQVLWTLESYYTFAHASSDFFLTTAL